MPVQRCQSNGTSGWKWGPSGHCYTGPNAKSLAAKQGAAARAAGFKEKIIDAIVDVLKQIEIQDK